jgi:SAM-dependent methyltransferase
VLLQDDEAIGSVYGGSECWSASAYYRYLRMVSTVAFCSPSRTRSTDSVLELGCGSGEFLAIAAHYLQSTRAIGLERSPTAVSLANRRYPGIDFHEGWIDSLPSYAESADVVCCLDVLRYLTSQDNQRAVDLMTDCIRPNGLLLVSTPADPSGQDALVHVRNSLRLRVLFSERFSLWPYVAIERERRRPSSDWPESPLTTPDFRRMERYERFCRRIFGKRSETHLYVVAARESESSIQQHQMNVISALDMQAQAS